MKRNIIKFKDGKIEYTVRRHRRARNLRITISCDGNVLATVPYGVSYRSAEKIIFEKAQWILERLKIIKSNGNAIFIRQNRREYLKLKEEARNFVKTKVKKYNRLYNFKYNKISIKNQKTRWGSCSESGNLNFNYKLLLLPEHLADYIIVHELCHLKELNHSKKFWDLVALTIPFYQARIKELRKLQS